MTNGNVAAARLYLFIHSRLYEVQVGATSCITGLGLGILTREMLHAVNEEFYSRTQTGRRLRYTDEQDYHSSEWNLGGLMPWEEQAVNSHFAGCKRVLVMGAGGGRETLALRRMGYQADGFEPHPDLVNVANKFLQAEGYEPSVHVVSPDDYPKVDTEYDGIILGWGMYTYIRGRKHRVAFLRQMRSRIREQGPILLSFLHRDGPGQSFKLAKIIANAIQRPLRKELSELGDWLRQEGYAHVFAQDELSSELAESGFSTVSYSTTGFPHAVGMAIRQ